MTSSVTSLNASPVFEPMDPLALKNSVTQINTSVAGIAAGFIRLNYLQAVDDHARTLQLSVNNCQKWPVELALLGQVINQTTLRLQDTLQAMNTSPSEVGVLQEEIQTALTKLVTAVKAQNELQRQRFQAVQRPLPNVQTAIADVTSLVSSVEAKRTAAAPKLIATANDLKTIDDALKVISELKLTEIAEKSLKSVADTIALKELKDPAAIVSKAGDLLKRTLGTVEESLTYLSLVENQESLQKLLKTLRADDERWALELNGMKERLEYLASVSMLDQQRVVYAEQFSRLPNALGRFMDHLGQPDADLAARLARLRLVCDTFLAFIKPR